MKTWSEKQNKAVIDLYGKMPADEIAKAIGKKSSQVKSQACELRKRGYDVAFAFRKPKIHKRGRPEEKKHEVKPFIPPEGKVLTKINSKTWVYR